jgi:hypothetical protein
MLPELFLYLATPASRQARKDGYVRASVSLWSIAHHCKSSWRAHEEACHDIIRHALKTCASKRTVVVLGSGLLRDIPLQTLAHTFEHVFLLDVVHPLPARVQTMFYRNVHHISMDVNGQRIRDPHAPEPSAKMA